MNMEDGADLLSDFIKKDQAFKTLKGEPCSDTYSLERAYSERLEAFQAFHNALMASVNKEARLASARHISDHVGNYHASEA